MDPREREALYLSAEERVEAALRKGETAEALELCDGLGEAYVPMMRRLRQNVEAAIDHVQRTVDGSQGELAAGIKAAIEEGKVEEALALLGEKRRQYLLFHDLAIGFMADWYSCVLRAFGPEALEQLFRYHAEVSREKLESEAALSLEDHVRWSAQVLVNHGTCFQIAEDEEKFTFVQDPCGTGGKLLEKAGDEAPAPVLAPSPMTWGQPSFSSYCAHCAMARGIVGIERFGRPLWVQEPPSKPGEPCIFHIYKDHARIPGEYYALLGKRKGEESER